jgi:hypothetical protein
MAGLFAQSCLVLMVLMLSTVLVVPAGPSFAATSGACAEDLAQGSWSSVPGGPLEARQGQATVWTGEELLVWGGQSAAEPARGLPAMFADGASYQPATRRWRPMAPSPLSPREGVAAAWAGKEAFIWGGYRPAMSGYHDYANGATYDTATGKWHLLPRAPLSARRGAEAFWTGPEVIVFGGEEASPFVAPVSGASYDMATGTWAKLPVFPRTGTGMPVSTAAAWTGRELLAVVTYEHIVRIPCRKPCAYADSITSRAAVAEWAPGWRSWRALQVAMPKGQPYAPTYGAEAAWAGKELVLLGGSACLPGMDCPAPLGPGGWAEAFDPAARSWSPLGPSVGAAGTWPVVWTGQALVLVDTGRYPGKNPPFTTAGSGAAFEPLAATWAPLPRAPIGVMISASAAWTRHQLLVWGSNAAGHDIAAVLTPSTVTGSGASSGYVEGTAHPCAGPVGARPAPGYVMWVAATQDGRTVALQFVETPFRFRVALPPGRYSFLATDDMARAVIVRPGAVAQLDLYSACG